MEKIANVLVFDSEGVSVIIGMNNENVNIAPLR